MSLSSWPLVRRLAGSLSREFFQASSYLLIMKFNWKNNVVITLLLWGLAIAVLSAKTSLPWGSIAGQLQKSYYFPFTNSCTVGKVGGLHFHAILLFLYILVCATTYLLQNFHERPLFRWPPEGLYNLLWSNGLIFLSLVILIQTFNHFTIFRKEFSLFSGQTLGEKNHFIFQDRYEFAKFCRKTLHGQNTASLISDLDFSHEPYRKMHRELSYFLLPDIKVRGMAKNQDTQVLIFYKKNHAAGHIPPGYKILATFDPSSLIAVKENTNHAHPSTDQ